MVSALRAKRQQKNSPEVNKMVPKIFAVYGASGCGRGVMPLARQMLISQNLPLSHLYFIDDGIVDKNVNGVEVLSYEDFLNVPSREKYIAIAIANSHVRERISHKLLRDKIHPWEIRADNMIQMDEVKIGNGSVLSPFVTLTSNIKIGDFFHANLYSYVEHDCVIGDFVTFAPAVKCNGNVRIEDHAYIGSGAVIKQGTPEKPLIIGRGATVGMGSVVTRSVPAGVTVVGNPARELIK